jgi:hypothetical protein
MVKLTGASGVLNRRLVQLLVGLLLGGAVGFIVYGITRVAGRDLFIITGAIAGVATAVTMQVYGHTARLTEVKVTVPHLSELTFVVNNDARQVAWALFVETVTRISVQPLASDEGLVREALASLYGLFSTTRDALKTSRPSIPVPGGQTVEYLAVTMLNRELRPFLSRWHPRLQQFEQAHPGVPESEWPENASCRNALQEVQEGILAYALGFARLAGVPEAAAMVARDSLL